MIIFDTLPFIPSHRGRGDIRYPAVSAAGRFIYALYLHGRMIRGWRGKKVAIVAVIGFMAVIFTYLGVNLLLSGLHAYGGS
jgi:ABC-type transport system involved in cytochrome c biogenesis permease subunit